MSKGLMISLRIPKKPLNWIYKLVDDKFEVILIILLSVTSIITFYYYYRNGIGLAYNDARSHLDIGRRVVEGLKPGFAQLGSVWLPLPHFLMTFTIWNDFMWHSGLAGGIISMISYVVTGILINRFLVHLKVDLLSRIIAVFVFATNLNILYLQSTAMTELLLIATMTFGTYELLRWGENHNIVNIVKSAFWIMLSTLVRYDGWFLLFWATVVIIYVVFIGNYKRVRNENSNESIKVALFKSYQVAEGNIILFLTLASFGIILWLLWNLLIFKDPLYFALGPYSAKAQQDQLALAGVLPTKHNIFLSAKFYLYALVFNCNAIFVFLGVIGSLVLWLDKKINQEVKLCSSALIAPLVFNIIALYVGHSVLFIQGLSGDTWFNVRYGIMLMPSISIYIGYLLYRVKEMKYTLIAFVLFLTFFSFFSRDAVTIDDARVGSSQKNVSEVSGWLAKNASEKEGFVLISAASHDAIIFSSGMPMKRFIHEGTGQYWISATTEPDQWARWIIVRTYDDNDMTWKAIKDTEGLKKYELVDHFPFADIYQLKEEYVDRVNTEPIIKQPDNL